MTTDFDVTVTWKRTDGSTVELPACVCFTDARDDVERRAEVMVEALTANLMDFPEDLPEGSLPVSVKF